MRASRLLPTIPAVILMITSQVVAAPITENVAFKAANFTSSFGQPVPVSPVMGSFTISFDPTLTYTDQTAGITLKALNITLGSALSFSFSPTGPSANELFVGGLQGGAGIISLLPPSDDFYLQLTNFTSNPTFNQLGYTQTSVTGENLFFTPTPPDGLSSVAVTRAVAVPEPVSLAVLGSTLVALGLTRRRHRRQQGLS